MPLVKGGKIVSDAFAHVEDDEPMPAEGGVLVSAKRFLAEPATLCSRVGGVGVIWPNNRDLDDLLPWLSRVAAVALVFPSFRDGRAYSQARLLRERHPLRRSRLQSWTMWIEKFGIQASSSAKRPLCRTSHRRRWR